MNIKIHISLIFLFILALIVPIKAPMIVVQGSIQLWPVTIINNSNMSLIVVDEISDPEGSSSMVRVIGHTIPNNQYTFQWPSTFQNPNAREITIYGRVNAVLKTNVLKLGNKATSTAPMIPSGDFTIINVNRRTICIADKLNPGQCSAR